MKISPQVRKYLASLLKDKEFIETIGRIQREFAIQALDLARTEYDYAYYKGARDFTRELYKIAKKASNIEDVKQTTIKKTQTM